VLPNLILTPQQVLNFRKKIYEFYGAHKRHFLWRETISDYHVFISEVMLQQTQTTRVTIKFQQWLQKFPSFESVASASNHEILVAWQGLGYNRRGLALQKAACMIVRDFAGQLPRDTKLLQLLPGIGPNTAGSICAFAFNMPVTFIETNIRTVFLHEFFTGITDVHDQQILSLVAQTVDHLDARNWYYALMDYGVHLKKTVKVNNSASKHYTRQSKFIGSRREVRGSIVRILTKAFRLSHDQLVEMVQLEIPHNQQNIELVLQQLLSQEFLHVENDIYFL